MDLYQYGISENYTNWVHHGETSQPRDSFDGSINSDNELENSGNDLFKDALPKGETLPSSSYEENENLDTCPTCKAPRWKLGCGKRKKVAIKILRHFLLVPRLQGLFMSKDIGENMRWHKEKRVDDDTIRYPADATEWKDFDQKYAWFGKDSRNVRLGLTSDGFNPFGNMSTSYSMWPVIVTPYNLPPWKCMKKNFLMLSLLIPGKESPGNNIDVYLRPLINELKELWETGVTTYDAYSAYGMLFGWSTKGKLACLVCNKWTCSLTLKNGVKQCYMGHRRYLHAQHSWRKSRKFDGKQEHGSKPEKLSGDEVLRQLDLLSKDLVFGKTPNQKKRARGPEELNWTKRKAMGIRKELHLQQIGNKFLMPLACYTLPKPERRMFCEWLQSIRLPDGYASNLSRCVTVQDCKVMGMKSHDYHIFLQRLLPASICGSLRSEVYTALSDFSSFFKELCSKTLKRSTVKKLQSDIILIICKLEMIYPPSFFVVMMHLAIHLPREVELGGPVHYRWMYFIERFLRTLKNYVRNLARLEGSIAEAYITKECLNFCSLYFHGVETIYNRVERNNFPVQIGVENGFSIFSNNARPLGATEYKTSSHFDFEKLQWYVLNNCEDVDEYLNCARFTLKNYKRKVLHMCKKDTKQDLPVGRLRATGLVAATDHIYALGLGPDIRIAMYSGIIVNGVRFHTVERDNFRQTQNNGVSVTGEHKSKEIEFCGVLTDIINLQYVNGNHVFLFKCDSFVLSSQVQQVFHVSDMKNGDNSHEVDQVGGENLELLHPIDVLPDEVDVGQMFQGQNPNPIYSSDEEDDTTINYDDADTDVLEDSNDNENEDEEDDYLFGNYSILPNMKFVENWIAETRCVDENSSRY
ncbi:uncharacterized protein LOC126672428 [Mercurialis annua]|uniref:uncharacterized protein LOC126672428 n=1 Tax=Mercurialis annua TaxID=3986 RepID=UPI0024AD2C23|nr:uncharacterized protein LOC126672428 [Mercurialis annua]